ncbi:hypothetical protein PCARR_b0255 [Pseudoalteromonas carrageenovora IAM 12662]|uniref:Uncharacterized protein n=1 Tax=Pseudoalteromonas carrageenovora IAM 12662 TaxID=1314868 RepID=A0ABR9EUR0_PSEVC|nr:hypothetical protein [Pseudoalteromonas carrageenovora IAM 12662]
MTIYGYFYSVIKFVANLLYFINLLVNLTTATLIIMIQTNLLFTL